MAETPEKTKPGRPESPTTARELDWDDDDAPSSPKAGRTAVEETTTTNTSASANQTKSAAPRVSEAETTLREAFPTIDAAVIKAVLVASGGQVEPAFNALLGMSDPSAAIEATPPVPPPRPAQVPQAQLTPAQRQMLQDEQYARQLAEHYNNQGGYAQGDRYQDRRDTAPRLPQRPGQQHQDDMYDDRERSFIDDDLPVIRDNIKKGFFETQKRAMGFIDTLRKQFDDNDSDEEQPPPPPPRKGQGQQPYPSRRSGDRDRYDADPQVLGDDFTKLQMHDETTPNRSSSRPQTNPDLFKSTPTHGSNRKVAFQDPSSDDLYSSPDPSTTKVPRPTPVGAGIKGKWQPMAAVDPDPVQEHDPFSLGDSDDEDAGKKTKDLKPEDSDRLKAAMEEGTADSIGNTPKKDLEAAKTTADGTKDAVAVEKVTSP